MFKIFGPIFTTSQVFSSNKTAIIKFGHFLSRWFPQAAIHFQGYTFELWGLEMVALLNYRERGGGREGPGIIVYIYYFSMAYSDV